MTVSATEGHTKIVHELIQAPYLNTAGRVRAYDELITSSGVCQGFPLFSLLSNFVTDMHLEIMLSPSDLSVFILPEGSPIDLELGDEIEIVLFGYKTLTKCRGM